MKVELTYPQPQKQRLLRMKLIRILKVPFLLIGYLCPILNLATGGKAWSLIVVWSLWLVWSTAISPSLVEYNRISQLIRLTVSVCVLLVLIDLLLSPGWAAEVVPIVCFSSLTAAAILLFTDFERQRQNLLPLLLMMAAALVGAVTGLLVWHNEGNWAMAVMGAFAFALLAACAFVLGPDFIREIKKRFHTR